MSLPSFSAKQVFRLNRNGAILLAATLITFALGESGLAGGRGAWPVLLMFGLVTLKSCLVILDFMELRHAPPLWRWLLIGWLTLVTLGILVAYGWSLRA